MVNEVNAASLLLKSEILKSIFLDKGKVLSYHSTCSPQQSVRPSMIFPSSIVNYIFISLHPWFVAVCFHYCIAFRQFSTYLVFLIMFR